MSGLHGGPAESGANDREVVQETQAYGGINPYAHQTDQIAGRGLDIRPYSKGIDTGCVVCHSSARLLSSPAPQTNARADDAVRSTADRARPGRYCRPGWQKGPGGQAQGAVGQCGLQVWRDRMSGRGRGSLEMQGVEVSSCRGEENRGSEKVD